MKSGFLFLAVLLSCAASAQTVVSLHDQAVDPAQRAVDIMAGPAWERARYFSFTFNVEREGQVLASFPQRWDRVTGDYRVEGRDPRGDQFVVIMNVNTKKGRGWRNGTAVEDPSELLELGARRFANDTFWLLMPLKSLESTVKRESVGERTDSCGRTWDVMKLTFEQANLPAGTNWMWVNRDTGLVEEWDMRLEGSNPDDSPTSVYFHDYKRVAGILFSMRREVRGKNQNIRIDDLVVTPDVPAGSFAK